MDLDSGATRALGQRLEVEATGLVLLSKKETTMMMCDGEGWLWRLRNDRWERVAQVSGEGACLVTVDERGSGVLKRRAGTIVAYTARRNGVVSSVDIDVQGQVLDQRLALDTLKEAEAIAFDAGRGELLVSEGSRGVAASSPRVIGATMPVARLALSGTYVKNILWLGPQQGAGLDLAETPLLLGGENTRKQLKHFAGLVMALRDDNSMLLLRLPGPRDDYLPPLDVFDLFASKTSLVPKPKPQRREERRTNVAAPTISAVALARSEASFGTPFTYWCDVVALVNDTALAKLRITNDVVHLVDILPLPAEGCRAPLLKIHNDALSTPLPSLKSASSPHDEVIPNKNDGAWSEKQQSYAAVATASTADLPTISAMDVMKPASKSQAAIFLAVFLVVIFALRRCRAVFSLRRRRGDCDPLELEEDHQKTTLSKDQKLRAGGYDLLSTVSGPDD